MHQLLKLVTFIVLILFIIGCAGNKNILSKTISENQELKIIAENPTYEVQIIYTQVNKNKKKFKSYHYKIDPTKYFYPASTVKMPVAILSLQKINELKKQGIQLEKEDIMMTAALSPDLVAAFVDTTNTHGKPTISRYIQKLFAVSDNDAYNRLYEWLGQDYINETLVSNATFTHSVINHRLGLPNLNLKDNQKSNHIRFFRNNKIVYDQNENTARKEWKHHAKDAIKGIGYLNAQDSLIQEPFDFTSKNFYSLQDMEKTLQKIIYPEFFKPSERFDLTESDYLFLKKSMSDLPASYSFYNKITYPDSYVKFLMYGSSEANIPDHIKIYNKVGNAYGYLIDCAFIEDQKNEISFFLTALIHVNKNQIYNDGKYEYEEIGLPFLKTLGLSVYEYEIKNRR